MCLATLDTFNWLEIKHSIVIPMDCIAATAMNTWGYFSHHVSFSVQIEGIYRLKLITQILSLCSSLETDIDKNKRQPMQLKMKTIDFLEMHRAFANETILPAPLAHSIRIVWISFLVVTMFPIEYIFFGWLHVYFTDTSHFFVWQTPFICLCFSFVVFLLVQIRCFFS